MKIRSGFVSNSSSSSFIMVGIEISDIDLTIDEMKSMMESANFDWRTASAKSKWYKIEEIEKDKELMYEFFLNEFTYNFLSKDNFVLRSGVEDGVNGTVVGKELASTGDGDYFDEINLLPSDINKIGQEVKEKFGVDGEARLFIGTRAC